MSDIDHSIFCRLLRFFRRLNSFSPCSASVDWEQRYKVPSKTQELIAPRRWEYCRCISAFFCVTAFFCRPLLVSMSTIFNFAAENAEVQIWPCALSLHRLTTLRRSRDICPSSWTDLSSRATSHFNFSRKDIQMAKTCIARFNKKTQLLTLFRKYIGISLAVCFAMHSRLWPPLSIVRQAWSSTHFIFIFNNK